MSRVFRRLAACLLAAVVAFGAAASAADATPGRLRIETTGGADSHGEIVFSFAEDGVEVTQIPVAIPKGTPENDVARRICNAFRRALPKDQYGVDVKGGENVLLTAQGHEKNFAIRLVRNTVSGTQISIARE
ncbi:MAG: hypothetical protein ACRES3_09595 [Steroidobacteraceae bacterium]